MKTSAKNLIGREVVGIDGSIGDVQDVYFDDERWVVRYLVVETGAWLSHRQVLISPLSVLGIGGEDSPVNINLTQAILETGPDVSTHEPVSRRFEIEYSEHFEYPIYWSGAGLWGAAMNPVAFAKQSITEDEERKILDKKSDESHLRSVQEVTGYHIQATDGSVGHIEDFVIDNESWAIGSIVVDTRNWLPGRKVTIDSTSIVEILWSDSVVRIDLDIEHVKEAPELEESFRSI